MPRKKSPIKNEFDALTAIASGLRQAVRSPNIHAYKPHEKQIEFHSSEAPGKQFLGGNRSGKTFAGACEAIFYSTGKHPYKKLPWHPPLRGRIVTVDVTQGLEKIILPQLKSLVPPSELINGSWEDSWDKSLRTLTLANGSFMEILTYEQDLEKFAGTSRHWIWFDEEPPKDIFTECMLRLLDTGGHWWMTMTPVEGMTWTFDDIYSKADIDPYLKVVTVDTDDNPHIGTEEKKRIFSTLTEEEVDARKKGQYVPLGGLIYASLLDPKIHYLDRDDLVPPLDWLHVASMDSGFTNPTAWLWAAIDKEGRIIIYDEYYKSQQIVSYHALQVHAKNKEHGRPPDYYVGDPSIRNRDLITGTSVHLEYLECGIPIVLGNNDVRAGIDKVKKYLTGLTIEGKQFPQLYITKNCTNLIWELARYRWAIYRDRRSNYEKNRKEEPQKKDDHACDALRYLLASRPELDTGTDVPALVLPDGVSKGVRHDSFKDDDVVRPVRKEAVDFHLGEEF